LIFNKKILKRSFLVLGIIYSIEFKKKNFESFNERQSKLKQSGLV